MNQPRESYDLVARDYAREITAVDRKPFDRERLDEFAARVGTEGLVLDIGCGPGDVTEYLHRLGVRIRGIDLSSAMVAEASRLHPGVGFEVGDMTALAIADGSVAGIVLFYAIVHLPPERVGEALRECRRILAPGGWMLVAVHEGKEIIHRDEWWGHPVNLDFFFYELEPLTAALREAGFTVVESRRRDPYPDIEHASTRLYLLAQRNR